MTGESGNIVLLNKPKRRNYDQELLTLGQRFPLGVAQSSGREYPLRSAKPAHVNMQKLKRKACHRTFTRISRRVTSWPSCALVQVPSGTDSFCMNTLFSISKHSCPSVSRSHAVEPGQFSRATSLVQFPSGMRSITNSGEREPIPQIQSFLPENRPMDPAWRIVSHICSCTERALHLRLHDLAKETRPRDSRSVEEQCKLLYRPFSRVRFAMRLLRIGFPNDPNITDAVRALESYASNVTEQIEETIAVADPMSDWPSSACVIVDQALTEIQRIEANFQH